MMTRRRGAYQHDYCGYSNRLLLLLSSTVDSLPLAPPNPHSFTQSHSLCSPRLRHIPLSTHPPSSPSPSPSPAAPHDPPEPNTAEASSPPPFAPPLTPLIPLGLPLPSPFSRTHPPLILILSSPLLSSRLAIPHSLSILASSKRSPPSCTLSPLRALLLHALGHSPPPPPFSLFSSPFPPRNAACNPPSSSLGVRQLTAHRSQPQSLLSTFTLFHCSSSFSAFPLPLSSSSPLRNFSFFPPLPSPLPPLQRLKMPRIPSREEPYHSVAKCNRHWKTKREFVTKAANKASHVDGSHYLLVCVTPKGNIEVHASEHFYDDASQTRLDGVINWEVLRRRATVIQSKNEERWTEIERQEKRFGVDGEDGDDDAADDDDDSSNKGAGSHHGSTVDFDPSLMDGTVDAATAQGRHTPAPGQHVFSAAKASPPRRIAAITITPMMLESVYIERFTHLGQSVCANILKAWIKVVEPKKQTKYPYKNKRGDEGKPPPWWPVGMRHIEPDHLHKEERPRLLASIIQQASRPRAEGSAAIAAATAPDLRELTISRLHFATAEISSSIPPRQHYELRQIYLIAKEVRKANEDKIREQRAHGIVKIEDRNAHLWTEITVDFFEKPPVGGVHPASKRPYDTTGMGLAFDPMADNKENVDFERHIKRGKHMTSPLNDMHHQQVPAPLTTHHNVYAVPSYGVEPHTPHTPYGGGWTVAPITIPPVQAATPTSAPSTAHLTSAGHQAQQQQAYYRAAMTTEISHSYPASNASYTPPQSQQTLHSASAPTPASAGTPAYGSTQSYSYQLNYSSSTPAPSATLYTAGCTPPGYAAYGPYEQQAFVNDIPGLSA